MRCIQTSYEFYHFEDIAANMIDINIKTNDGNGTLIWHHYQVNQFNHNDS